MVDNRDNFRPKIVEILKKRASFICSNPSCKKMTVAPSEIDEEKILYIGRAAHICAASKGGPRYDVNMTEDQRSSIENALFLCSNCADMIDDNGGIDFQVSQLKTWKNDHEKWVRDQINKAMTNSSTIQQTVYNVSSQNQTGGITAGVVNFEKPGRHLNPQLIQQLQTMLPDQNEKVQISAQMGNLEAITFAEEIRQHLLQRGFNISEVGQIMGHPPIIGQTLTPDRDGGKHLIVGMQK